MILKEIASVFLCNRKFRWNFLLHKKPYRAGSHCGGKVVVARGDPPQAENPASRILQTVDKALLLQGFAIIGTAFLI